MPTVYGDRWEVVASLGEGGQAHTFIAVDKKGGGDTQYVVKRLKNLDRIERFKREIEVIRNFSHENIVRLVDFDLEAAKPYMVTEYCKGGSLRKAKPFWQGEPLKALALFLQICEGVREAHLHEIIHRDLKPDNIFLRTDTGPAVVGDFGICYVDDDGERLTLTEEAAGPRLYIAPELEDGRLEQIAKKSDSYSLGKLLYWLLSGKEFSREKHREPRWDLRGKDDFIGWRNIYMEHVNRLLDFMIVADIDQRRDVDQIIHIARETVRLVRKEFTPIGKDTPKPCQYCGQGYYQLSAADNMDVRNFGFIPVGAPDWRIYTCDTCGHVQAFRVDMASKKHWWAK